MDDTTVLHAVDMLPTLAALGGAKLPVDYQSDGEDLSAALLEKPAVRGHALFWEYGRNDTSFKYPAAPDRSPNVAMREGQWKLFINADGTGAELYDILADPYEARNVATENPAIAQRMTTAALAWRKAMP